jgi:hypothetical protein
MRFWSGFRAAVVALSVLAFAGMPSAALADSGTVWIKIVKGGWIIGGAVGSGGMTFHGKSYSLAVGGLSVGLLFGGSITRLHGTVSHIQHASDIEGVYGAAGAGAAVVIGAQAVVLKNPKGAVLTLTGKQIGLIADADLSGLALSLR